MSVVVSNQIARIEHRLDLIIDEIKKMRCDNSTMKQKESKTGLKIFVKKYMVWWTKVNEASSYRLKLFIKEGINCPYDEIDSIEIDRNKSYHTFKDLVESLNYKVDLEVENRNGEIIDSVSITF